MVYCRDENRHCAMKSKGIRVRFPCIPLHDRVSSSRRRLGQCDSYAQERQLDENKVRGEKAKKDLEKNPCRSWEESWENRWQLSKLLMLGVPFDT